MGKFIYTAIIGTVAIITLISISAACLTQNDCHSIAFSTCAAAGLLALSRIKYLK